MPGLSPDLSSLADRLAAAGASLTDPAVVAPLDRLQNAAEEVGKAWSGSWLGYHSRVYYRSLRPPPPGAHFSQEWGLKETAYVQGTVGDWQEFEYDAVRDAIVAKAGNPDLSAAETASEHARATFDEARAEIVSLLHTALTEREDPLLVSLLADADKTKVRHSIDFVRHFRPTGQVMTRDMVALNGGLPTPPHLGMIADMLAFRQPLKACDDLAKVARRAAAHLARRERHGRPLREVGTNVFIGHGRSPLWRDLKDFVRDRMRLPYDEFNRVPVAGVTNVARLAQMLDDAAVAFVVMTAEDEQADGAVRARMNVVHEAGLFQGRLGFTRAIVLLEEGCEEFSNIQGLGQIRFPRGDIRAAFEEVRQVLEREGLVPSP